MDMEAAGFNVLTTTGMEAPGFNVLTTSASHADEPPADAVPNVSAADAASASRSTSSEVAGDSFVCPFTGCGVSCTSRDEVIAHVQLSHEAADIIPPVCKQEKDDSAPGPK